MNNLLKRWITFTNGGATEWYETYRDDHLQKHLMSIIDIDEFIKGGSSDKIPRLAEAQARHAYWNGLL